jgi:hypothetical protein
MTTALTNARDDALLVGFAATDWTEHVGLAEYMAQLKEWNVRAIVRDGEIIGAVYSKDGEVHASVLPKWRKRWATKGLLNEIFSGQNMTRVTPGHEYMHCILKRLGFSNADDGKFVKE